MLAPSTRSGIITPFGSLVEPLVYCRMTSRSGSWRRELEALADWDAAAPGSTDAIGAIGGSPGAGLVERGEQVVDQHELGVAVADAGRGSTRRTPRASPSASAAAAPCWRCRPASSPG